MSEDDLFNSDKYFFASNDFNSGEIPNIEKTNYEKHYKKL